MKKRLCAFAMLFVFCSFVFADDTYSDINFPQWTKDLRRTSVISFGSLPFVTLWVTVGYAAISHGSFHNPLDKSTSGFSSDEQKEIIQIAALISLSLGVTDLILNIIGRTGSSKKKIDDSSPVKITPLKENADFHPRENSPNREEEDIHMPDNLNEGAIPSPQKEYLQGGLTDAIF